MTELLKPCPHCATLAAENKRLMKALIGMFPDDDKFSEAIGAVDQYLDRVKKELETK